MVRSVGLVILVVLAFASGSAVAMAKPATPAASHGCDDLLLYWHDVSVAYPGQLVEGELDAFNVYRAQYANLATFRTETLLSAADYFNAYLDRLDEVEDVPPVMKGLHEAYIDHVVLLSRLAQAHAEGRVSDAILIASYLERNDDRIRAELEAAVEACGDQWLIAPVAYRYLPSDWWKTD